MKECLIKAGLIGVVAIILVLFLNGGIVLQASTGSVDLKSIAEEYDLSNSETRELTRAYLGAVKVGVDSKRLEGLIERSLAAEIDIKHLVRVVTLVANTAINGLPVSPVLNKFSEGLAKRVNSEDLVDAIENRALSLNLARKMLSLLIYEEIPVGNLNILLVSVADALDRGVKESKIEKVFKEGNNNFKGIISEIEKLK